jgi:hypothetical protein
MFRICSWADEDLRVKNKIHAAFGRYSVPDTVIRQAMGWTFQDSEFCALWGLDISHLQSVRRIVKDCT